MNSTVLLPACVAVALGPDLRLVRIQPNGPTPHLLITRLPSASLHLLVRVVALAGVMDAADFALPDSSFSGNSRSVFGIAAALRSALRSVPQHSTLHNTGYSDGFWTQHNTRSPWEIMR
jgi:hypothetical protein